MSRRTMEVGVDPLPFREPLKIANLLVPGLPGIRITLGEDDATGRGEAAGVFFLGDDVVHMRSHVDETADAICDGASRDDLQALLPAGGARNALDAALWELDARKARTSVWRLAGLPEPKPLLTTFTIGADDLATIARKLSGLADARAIKLKLDGDLETDVERVRLIRARRPDVWLMVDANQGYDAATLDRLFPVLADADVKLLEQPLRLGDEASLEGLHPPVPIAADESVLEAADVDGLVDRFQFINIKLDKCGGLTEGLRMLKRARELGLGVMIGNMGGSSLAAAPAFMLAQLCDVVDLDGPKFLEADLPGGAVYEDGFVHMPAEFWGR